MIQLQLNHTFSTSPHTTKHALLWAANYAAHTPLKAGYTVNVHHVMLALSACRKVWPLATCLSGNQTAVIFAL